MSGPGTFGLTRTQRDTMRILQELTDAGGGVTPNYGDIARELGLGGRGGVVRLVDALTARGYLTRMRGRARSIEILRRVPMAEEAEIVGLFDEPGLAAAIGAAGG